MPPPRALTDAELTWLRSHCEHYKPAFTFACMFATIDALKADLGEALDALEFDYNDIAESDDSPVEAVLRQHGRIK